MTADRRLRRVNFKRFVKVGNRLFKFALTEVRFAASAKRRDKRFVKFESLIEFLLRGREIAFSQRDFAQSDVRERNVRVEFERLIKRIDRGINLVLIQLLHALLAKFLGFTGFRRASGANR